MTILLTDLRRSDYENTAYQNIVIGVDFDHQPTRLIEKASQLNLHKDCTIHLIHILHFLPETYYVHYSITTASMTNNMKLLKDQSIQEAEEKLIALKQGFSHLSIKTHLLEGSAVDSIIDFATEHQSDLIILNNYHKPGLIRLLGSTINGIMQQSPCDVLIVKS